MSDTPKTLLPEGLRDLLPIDAALEDDVVHRLGRSFSACGYELVKPPLIEFEDTLLAGVGMALRESIFRMPDPASHRILGVRADFTTQVARIAATRLAQRARPLRLMYVGPVLRVKGDQLAPERQFTQAGIELIGPESGPADAEVILATVDALKAIDVADITVDLALPTLVPLILGKVQDTRLRTALDHKDIAEIKAVGGAAGGTLTALVEAAGPFDSAVARVAKINLAPQARAEWDRLVSVGRAVLDGMPDLTLTVDAVENRGFEYHTGVTFSVFAKGAQREIGRGGRYQLTHGGEPATGATLFVDALMGVVPQIVPSRRLYIPFGTPRRMIRPLQEQGWTVVCGLEACPSAEAEARRLECGHYLADGWAVAVSSTSASAESGEQGS
jgi:ATP phosphoribosyltransferase regulatory subunit